MKRQVLLGDGQWAASVAICHTGREVSGTEWRCGITGIATIHSLKIDGSQTGGWIDWPVFNQLISRLYTHFPPLGKHGRWNGIKDQDRCRKNNFQVSWKDEYSSIPYESSRHKYVNIPWIEQKYLPNRARPRDPSLAVWTEPWQVRFYSFNSFTLRWTRRRGSWAISLNAMSTLRTDNKNKSHYCKQPLRPMFTTAQIIRKWLRNGFSRLEKNHNHVLLESVGYDTVWR